jgi:hypothetical protein
MITGFVCAALWFAIFAAGQVVVLRSVASGRPQATNRLLLGCLAAAIVSVVLIVGLSQPSVWTHGDAIMGCLWAVLTFGCLLVLYMPFYYTIASSLSVRTIVLLSEIEGEGMTVAAVRELFMSPELIGHRLNTMSANGFLKAADQTSFVVTRKGRAFATVFNDLNQLWRMGPGG